MLEIQLVAVADSKADEAHPVAGESCLVGRHKQCDLIFDDRSVSKTHCVFQSRFGQALVTDLGSRKGTIVNGLVLQLGETAPLQDGDLVELGIFTFRLSIRDPETGEPRLCQEAYVGDLPYPLIALPQRRCRVSSSESEPTKSVDEPIEVAAEPTPEPNVDKEPDVATEPPVEPVDLASRASDASSNSVKRSSSDRHRAIKTAGSSSAAKDALEKMFPGKKGR